MGLQFHFETEGLMTDKWIKSDKKFIISALGEYGQKILRNQWKEFELNAFDERVLFIKELFKIIIKHKKTPYKFFIGRFKFKFI